MPQLEPMQLRIIATADGLKSEMGKAQQYVRITAQQIAGHQRHLSASISSIGSALSRLTSLPALVAGGSIGFGLKLAADIETAQVQFEVLTGSAQGAKTVIEELAKFSATTPFQMPEVQGAARQLLAAKFSLEELQTELRALGNIAAATGIPFEELAQVVAKAKTDGRVGAEELNSLGGRGINIIDALAKRLGIAGNQVRDFASKGKISFEDLNAALLGIGIEEYAGATEKLAKTASGALSTLGDNLKGLAASVAGVFLPAVTQAVQSVNGWVESIRSLSLGTSETTAKIAAASAAFAASILIIPKIVAAVQSIIQVLRTLRISLISIQALSGPKGWATLAASVGVAAAAVYGIDQAFVQYEQTLTAASSAQGTAAKTAEALAESKAAMDGLGDSATEAADQMQRQVDLAKELKSIGLPKAEIRGTAEDLQSRFQASFQRTAINDRELAVMEDMRTSLRNIERETRRANDAPPVNIS